MTAETLTLLTPVSILLWFLLFYSPFIILIENTTITASAKKKHKNSNRTTQKNSTIDNNLKHPLPHPTTHSINTIPPNNIPCNNTHTKPPDSPVSQITIIPTIIIIISTTISFSFLIHYYQNALQKT